MASTLEIIIVNRNSGEHLRACLQSIAAADKTGITLCRVCVVDDCSSDNSMENFDQIPLPLDVIRRNVRTGYGGSCNRGAANGVADYLLFLNTDTCLHHKSLTVPVQYMEQGENAGVGIVGIKLLDEQGMTTRLCSRFPTIRSQFIVMLGLDRILPSVFQSQKMKEWDHVETRQVDQIIGAFMLIRRALFEQLGGYDERFFVYMEDLDLSLRASQLGYKSMYLGTAKVTHIGGGTANRVKAESLFFLLRSRIQYGYKHFGPVRGTFLLLGIILLEPVTRFALGFLRRSIDELRWTLSAYAQLWKWFRDFVTKPPWDSRRENESVRDL
jgi:GT2 family glycosyltransferase